MKQLISSLRKKMVFHISGCGSSALGELCINSGSSSIVLEGCEFYSRGSLETELQTRGDFKIVEKFVSGLTAERIALNAFIKAQSILLKQKEHSSLSDSIGVGLTGQIGHHRTNQAFLSIQSASSLHTFHLTFADALQGKDDRILQDKLISDAVFLALQQYHAENSSDYQHPQLDVRLNVQLINEETFTSPLSFLDRFDHVKNIIIYQENSSTSELPFAVNQKLSDCVLFSGSFNPIHDAHVEIAEAARGLNNRDWTYFELPLRNADKGQKSHETLLDLSKRILEKTRSSGTAKSAVVFSKASLFTEKCEFTSNSTFALGMDTFKRLLDAKYYENSDQNRTQALAKFLAARINFVVAPRFNSNSKAVEALDSLQDETPKYLQPFVHELKDYRNDISSTLLRQQNVQTQSK